MPSKSAKQQRAMLAALHGKSKSKIPKSVARKYVSEDKRLGMYAFKKSKRKGY